MIEIRNLFKNFQIGGKPTPVLENINLEIHKGEFVSITGASGSGKSTLLYLLGALDTATSGEIIVDGVSLANLKDKEISKYRRQHIGFVFQFYNLVQNLTVEENILLPVVLDGKKVKAYQSKLDELLKYVGLENMRKQKGALLSGGQQQRVAVARALINNPMVILADEPIGNLDSVNGAEIMALLQKINREKGVTIIQVTHSPESVKYGTRQIVLKDGKIIA